MRRVLRKPICSTGSGAAPQRHGNTDLCEDLLRPSVPPGCVPRTAGPTVFPEPWGCDLHLKGKGSSSGLSTARPLLEGRRWTPPCSAERRPLEWPQRADGPGPQHQRHMGRAGSGPPFCTAGADAAAVHAARVWGRYGVCTRAPSLRASW